MPTPPLILSFQCVAVKEQGITGSHINVTERGHEQDKLVVGEQDQYENRASCAFTQQQLIPPLHLLSTYCW